MFDSWNLCHVSPGRSGQSFTLYSRIKNSGLELAQALLPQQNTCLIVATENSNYNTN